MKKVILFIALVAMICIPAFAKIEYTVNGLTLSAFAQLNLASGKNILDVQSVDFDFNAEYGSDFGIIKGELIYEHSKNDADKRLSFNAGFIGNVLDIEDQFTYVIDTSLDFNKKTGSYKPYRFLGRFGCNYSYHDFSLGSMYFYDQYNQYWLKQTADVGKPYPHAYIGYVHYVDNDPEKSGLIGGIAASYKFGAYKPSVRLNGMLHFIDNKVVVENGEIEVSESHTVGAAGINPSITYKYSYNKGPETNGLYFTLVSKSYKFADVSAKVQPKIVCSIHNVDGAFQFQANEFSLSPEDNAGALTLSYNEEHAGASYYIDNIVYKNYADNKETDNGLFFSLDASLWNHLEGTNKFKLCVYFDSTFRFAFDEGKLIPSISEFKVTL